MVSARDNFTARDILSPIGPGMKLGALSYPCENLGSTVLHLPHTSNLLVALMDIVLIDAD
jgi:hypothetical protein